MTLWERRRLPTLDELKPIKGQLSLDELEASSSREGETHLANSASEQSTQPITEETTALDGLIDAISSQR